MLLLGIWEELSDNLETTVVTWIPKLYSVLVDNLCHLFCTVLLTWNVTTMTVSYEALLFSLSIKVYVKQVEQNKEITSLREYHWL